MKDDEEKALVPVGRGNVGNVLSVDVADTRDAATERQMSAGDAWEEELHRQLPAPARNALGDTRQEPELLYDVVVRMLRRL